MPDLANVESKIKSDIAAATAKATRGERVQQQKQQLKVRDRMRSLIAFVIFSLSVPRLVESVSAKKITT